MAEEKKAVSAVSKGAASGKKAAAKKAVAGGEVAPVSNGVKAAPAEKSKKPAAAKVAKKASTAKPAKTVAKATKPAEKAKKPTKLAAKAQKPAARKKSKKAADSAPLVHELLRIRLKSFDHRQVDLAARRLVETVKKTGTEVRGPIPLPVRKERVTVLISPHKHKDARDQYEIRTYVRILDLVTPTENTMDTMRRMELAAGVDVSIVDVRAKSDANKR